MPAHSAGVASGARTIIAARRSHSHLPNSHLDPTQRRTTGNQPEETRYVANWTRRRRAEPPGVRDEASCRWEWPGWPRLGRGKCCELASCRRRPAFARVKIPRSFCCGWTAVWHMDMYDMKPDAPAEYRGIWSPIPTNVPGMEVTESTPSVAGQDRRSILGRAFAPP